MGVEFKPVAAAALAMSHVLLPEWLGGQRKGAEWVGERRINGGPGDSWAVNLNTGAWLHGAGSERGGDLISLYAALNHIDQLAALKEVADMVGAIEKPVRKLAPKAAPPESNFEEIPPDAPPVPPHKNYGKETALYRYGWSFVVTRYERPDRPKVFSLIRWGAGRWQFGGYTGPRPIYGAELLIKHPETTVLVVEGEKACEAARSVLKSYTVVTWSGGANAVEKTDWTPLKDRDVIIWPDADAPGAKAGAELATILTDIPAARVYVINPADQPAGWDVADAIEEGWDAPKIAAWAKANLQKVHPREETSNGADHTPKPPKPVKKPPAKIESTPPATVEAHTIEAGVLQDSSIVNWQMLNLDCNEGGTPHPTVANVSMIIQAHPLIKGRIWYDSFRDKIYHSLRGGEQQWTDGDDVDLTVRIQQELRLPKFTTRLVTEGISHAARLNARNSLTCYLDTLQWDGVPRLDTWISDCLGVERNPYTMAVARNWPISMIARAYVPGCQVDTMVVLEGHMGRGKSKFLEILGSPFFKSLPMAFGDKDWLQAIQGAWLIEVPDLTGFSRREHSHILATITIRVDEYRRSYGRHVEAHPRVAILTATSETDDYLQDTRGRRRYWPLRCTDIDLDALHSQRDQVFAEAILEYKEGKSWHIMPDETDEEQLARATPDLWTDRVMDYAEEVWQQAKTSRVAVHITSQRILQDAIEVPLSKQTDIEKRRIARIMRENGWIQVREKFRYWKKVERRHE